MAIDEIVLVVDDVAIDEVVLDVEEMAFDDSAIDEVVIGVDSDLDNLTSTYFVIPWHEGVLANDNYQFGIRGPPGSGNYAIPYLVPLGASENLASLKLWPIDIQVIATHDNIPSSFEGDYWTLLYMTVTKDATSSGPLQLSHDIFDKYFTRFLVDYKVWNNDTQSYEDRQEWFDSPNDLTKYLLNLDPDQEMPWIPNYSLSPNDSYFPEFFARLDDLLNNPERADDLGRLICRTARGPPQQDDVYQQLAVLSALSQDPLNQDDMYPTLVQLVEWDHPP